jgi:hypothetical protein
MAGDSASTPKSPLIHLIERLRGAEVALEPYPHFYLEYVFPEDYYQTLLGHLPGGTLYQNLYEVTDLKLDHFRHRDQRDMTPGWTETMPAEIKTFWDRFSGWFLGPELAMAALRSFTGPLQERFGDEARWPAVSVEAQLIRHREGYFLGPHSDLWSKIVVLLFYLAPDERAAHLGTSIYRPKDPNFSCPKSAHYPFEDFIKVMTAPYRPNSLLAFLRSDRSFHGVEPLSSQDAALCDRDLIQYVVYDKQAREGQVRARHLPSASGGSE